ncbi:hypothetical protein KAR10_06245, partial [bacterium]|nr:hypothetical protein [bacterium]
EPKQPEIWERLLEDKEIKKRFTNIYRSQTLGAAEGKPRHEAEALSNQVVRDRMRASRYQLTMAKPSPGDSEFEQRLEKIRLADNEFAARMDLTIQLDAAIKSIFAKNCFEEEKTKASIPGEIGESIARLEELSGRPKTDKDIPEEVIAIIRQLEQIDSGYGEYVLEEQKKYSAVKKEVLAALGDVTQAAGNIVGMDEAEVGKYYHELGAAFPSWKNEVEQAQTRQEEQGRRSEEMYVQLIEHQAIVEELFGSLIDREAVDFPALAGLLSGYPSKDSSKRLDQETLNLLGPGTPQGMRKVIEKIEDWQALSGMFEQLQPNQREMLTLLLYGYTAESKDKILGGEQIGFDKGKMSAMLKYGRTEQASLFNVKRKNNVQLTDKAESLMQQLLSTGEIFPELDWHEVLRKTKRTQPDKIAIALNSGEMEESVPLPVPGKIIREMREGKSKLKISNLTRETGAMLQLLGKLWEDKGIGIREADIVDEFKYAIIVPALEELKMFKMVSEGKEYSLFEKAAAAEEFKNLAYIILKDIQELKAKAFAEDDFRLFQRALVLWDAAEIIRMHAAGEKEKIRQKVYERYAWDSLPEAAREILRQAAETLSAGKTLPIKYSRAD